MKKKRTFQLININKTIQIENQIRITFLFSHFPNSNLIEYLYDLSLAYSNDATILVK